MPTLLEGKLRPLSLQFTGELEQEFLDDYFDRTLKQFRASVFLALFLFSLTGFLDAYLFPDLKAKIWLIRYAFVCPCVLALYLFTYTPFIRKYKQQALSLGLFIGAAGMITIITIVPSPINYYYYAGLLTLTMYTYTLSTLRFVAASAVSLTFSFLYLIEAYFINQTPMPILSISTFSVLTINAMGMASGYAMEFYVRKNFLQKRTIESRTLELEEKNQELISKNEELQESREELLRSVKRAEMLFSALSEALPGTVLDDKYRLDQKIGSGGFGTVYRAQHLLLQHPVAVKIFKPSTGADPLKNLERFRLEGISACRIQHPNAVSVLDFGVSQNSIAYMVMELLEGHSLQEELLKYKRLPVGRCAEILRPVCSVLAEAHARDIVHRDIKPGNIFLHQAKDGEMVKVVDFGIAKLMSDAATSAQESLTETGTFVGTPVYMSPERLSNKPYDGRSDVYSVGVMMYEMLCGVVPFQPSKEHYWSVVMMHISHSPQPPREVNPEIPEALEAVVLGALEKDPRERPTARELENLLAAFVSKQTLRLESLPANSSGGETIETLPATRIFSAPNRETQTGDFDKTADLMESKK